MESLLKLLPDMIRHFGEQEDIREQAAFIAWRVTTGEQLAHTCRPFRLHRETLVVAVLDESWKKQLESMSRLLMFKMNGVLGHRLVTYIEFRVDPAHVAAGQKPEPDPKSTTDRVPAIDLQMAASGIKDEELRQLFLRVAAASTEEE